MKNLQVFAMSKMSSYKNYVCDVKPIVNEIKSADKTFYRMEKTFQRTNNDPMQFNYNGLSHYSSCEKTFVKSFLEKMGFRNNGNLAYYNKGSTVSVDSFLGVKYLASKDELKKDYEYLFSKNYINVYKNPYALSLGFAADRGALNKLEYGSSYFENQDMLAASVLGDSYIVENKKLDIKDNNAVEFVTEYAGSYYLSLGRKYEGDIEFSINGEKTIYPYDNISKKVF